jgi:hypothetical protein
VLTYFVLVDPNVVHNISSGQHSQVAQSLGEKVKEKLDQASDSLRAKNSSAPPALASLFSGKSGGQTNSVKPATNSQPTNVLAPYPQQSPAPAASWSGAASPAAPAAVPSGYATPPPAANQYYAPANNQPAAAPPQQGPVTRFWQ